MSIDTAAILAEQYKNNPNQLRAAVLGQGTDINPYAALRALQLQKVAERYEMMQAALAGQQAQNQPSMVEQALAPTQMPQMPQGMPQGMPQQQPQMPQQGGLPQMQQPQQASQGLAGMPAPEGEYAGGGIVAFAGEDGSLVEGDDETAALGANQMYIDDLMPSPGDPRTHAELTRMIGPSIRNIRSQEYTPYTAADRKAAIRASREDLKEGAGEDPSIAYGKKLDEFDAQRQKSLDQASGYGLLAAAGDVLEPGGLTRGIGKAAKTYAGAMQQAQAASKAEERALMNMKFQLADSQRKERMGLTRDAMSMAQQAQKSHYDAQMFKQRRLIAEGRLVTDALRATKPTGGAGGAGKPPKGMDAFVAAEEAYALNPTPGNLAKVQAFRDAYGYRFVPGPEQVRLKEEATDTTQGTKINEQMAEWEFTREGSQYKKGTPEYKAARKAKEDELRANYRDGNKNSSETKKSGKVATQADIDATVAKSGRTEAEVRAALKSQGYTIK